MTANARSVLVTGAGSGIGLATAEWLTHCGYRVFGGVHRVAPPRARFASVVLDVTDPDSVETARRDLDRELGDQGLFALVNNAGLGLVSPLEFTARETLRKVFDVNVFGLVTMTQAFLPLLRRGGGRIVNLGSVGGLITIPFGGALTASKHAVEAVSDAFRLELHAEGIPVTCLQPASINSGSAEKLAAQTEATIAALPPDGQGRYGEALRHFVQVMVREETSGSPPEEVARAVEKVLAAKNPPPRRIVGRHGKLLALLARDVPDRARDALLRKVFLSGENPD